MWHIQLSSENMACSTGLKKQLHPLMNLCSLKNEVISSKTSYSNSKGTNIDYFGKISIISPLVLK